MHLGKLTHAEVRHLCSVAGTYQQEELLFVSIRGIIVCVGMDKWCVPDLYSVRPFYEYPSQVKDLLHCVSDIPKFLPPEPVAMIPLAPKKISFQKEVKEWNARHEYHHGTRREKRTGEVAGHEHSVVTRP